MKVRKPTLPPANAKEFQPWLILNLKTIKKSKEFRIDVLLFEKELKNKTDKAQACTVLAKPYCKERNNEKSRKKDDMAATH